MSARTPADEMWSAIGTLLVLLAIIIPVHIRVHRREIKHWYTTVFAPKWRPRVAKLRPHWPLFTLHQRPHRYMAGTRKR